MSKLFISFTVLVIVLACILPSINKNICPCEAQAQTAIQSISDLTDLYSSLSPQTQQAILELLNNSNGGTGNPEQLPIVSPPTTQPTTMPHGRYALRYFRENNPGDRLKPHRYTVKRKVQSAVRGYPNYGHGPDIIIPEDRPDFWDRVKRVFLLALIDAFTNIPTTQPTIQPIQ